MEFLFSLDSNLIDTQHHIWYVE